LKTRKSVSLLEVGLLLAALSFACSTGGNTNQTTYTSNTNGTATTNTATTNTVPASSPSAPVTNSSPSARSNTNTGNSGAMTTITINQQSQYDIHRVYLSPTNQSQWGPDQLGAEILTRGESYTIQNVPCGSYDIRLVDEDADECEMRNREFCGANNTLQITDQELLRCQGETRR